jgi:hypothetical protein
MRKGARVRVKSAPNLACPICGKRVVGLSRRQEEEDLRNGRGIRIYETLLTLDTWKRKGQPARGAVESSDESLGWLTFVTESGVEPTNNRAERALRELVVQRKIIGTLRNEKGIFIRDPADSLGDLEQRGLDSHGELSRA